MAVIHWLHHVTGEFDDAADWKGGTVPGPTDDAVASDARYGSTITVSTNTTINSLSLKNIVFAIESANFTAGTINNGGGHHTGRKLSLVHNG